MRRYIRYRSLLDVIYHDRQQQGMTLLQVVFALGVFVIFGSVFLAVSEQLTLYSPVGNPDAKEEAPVPILLAERLASAMERLVSALEQPGADPALFPLGLDGCSSNPLQAVAPNLAGIFVLDNIASNESEFQLGSRYQFCLFKYEPEQPVEGPQLYALIAKPEDATAVMLPVVRRIFCRPKPYCDVSSPEL